MNKNSIILILERVWIFSTIFFLNTFRISSQLEIPENFSPITSYSKIIDFFVFFVIFTTITLIGLKAMFKDKDTQRQITALAVAIGVMCSLALIFGGTFLGYEISVFTLFPYAIGFLIFAIIFLPIFLILHFLFGKKHPVWAFFIALLIGLLIYFLLVRPISLGSLNLGRGGGGGSKGGSGGDGNTKNELEAKLKAIEKDIESASVLITEGEKLKSEGNQEDAKKKGESARTILIDAFTELSRIDTSKLKSSETDKITNLKEKIATLTKQAEILAERTKDGVTTTTIAGGGGGNGKVGKECDEIKSFTEETFLSEIWDKQTNVIDNANLNNSEMSYRNCIDSYKQNKISQNDFDTATLTYNSELAKGLFKVGRFEDAYNKIIRANADTGGQGNSAIKSRKKTEILKVWYDDIIAQRLNTEAIDIEEIFDYVLKSNALQKLKIRINGLKSDRDKSILARYVE